MRKYLSLNEVIILHRYLIEEFGGSQGIRSLDSLKSALMRPQSGYYEDIINEAVALMESLAMNHPFIDGNKRVAFFFTDVFLRLNKYYIECDSESAHKYVMDLFETNNFNFDNLLPWFKKHIKKI